MFTAVYVYFNWQEYFLYLILHSFIHWSTTVSGQAQPPVSIGYQLVTTYNLETNGFPSSKTTCVAAVCRKKWTRNGNSIQWLLSTLLSKLDWQSSPDNLMTSLVVDIQTLLWRVDVRETHSDGGCRGGTNSNSFWLFILSHERKEHARTSFLSNDVKHVTFSKDSFNISRSSRRVET